MSQVNLNTLYNKVPYFKKINQNNRPARRQQNRVSENEENNEENNENKNQYEIFKHLTRFVLSVKNISVNYSDNRGTFLPGYVSQPHFLGQDWAKLSPGLPFVLEVKMI